MTFRELVNNIEFIIIFVVGCISILRGGSKKENADLKVKPCLLLRVIWTITFISMLHELVFLLGNSYKIVYISSILKRIEIPMVSISVWGYMLQAWVQLRNTKGFFREKATLFISFCILSPILIWLLLM